MNEERSPAREPLAARIFETVEYFAVAFCAVLLFFTFAARICVVKGPSMDPTLADGQRLIVSDLFWEPQAGDVVVFHQTGTLNEAVVKRLIALPGQTVELDFRTGTLRVDGSVVEESYAYLDGGAYWNTAEYNTRDGVFTLTVPDGCYFVMGDNRNHSTDSRSLAIGPVDARRMLGRVVLRLTPFSAFGIVE